MPDPRPLSSLRFGAFDEPPATSESSSTRDRYFRLRRPVQNSSDEPRAPRSPINMFNSDSIRRSYTGSLSRRRRRSESAHDVDQDIAPEAGGRDEGRRQRNKRRRLDSSPPPKPLQPIKYGYYGQVEPGRLKLELVSCDGGEHKDPNSPEDLGPQNILRHDKSVYCSERHSINVVLRHADDTPFCLEKLHIVGPEHGFTAPVREGLVHVAMTMADLQGYIDTEDFSAIPAPSAPPEPRVSNLPTTRLRNRLMERSLRSSPERLTLADALRDPEVNAALAERHNQEESYTRLADNAHDLVASTSTGESYYGNDFGFGRTDPEAHCEIPPTPPLNLSNEDGGSNPSNDRPITLLSDEEPGPEDVSPPGWLDYRLQRLRIMRRRYEMDAWDREERWAGLNRMPPDPPGERERGARDGTWNLSRLDALMARSRVNDSASASPPPVPTPPGATAYPQIPTESYITTSNPSTNENAVTHAKFHIKRGKHKVAMKFEPPLSGRFILLKLWSGSGGGDGRKGNVDVQSVIAKGFGGGRFFPARSVR